MEIEVSTLDRLAHLFAHLKFGAILVVMNMEKKDSVFIPSASFYARTHKHTQAPAATKSGAQTGLPRWPLEFRLTEGGVGRH